MRFDACAFKLNPGEISYRNTPRAFRSNRNGLSGSKKLLSTAGFNEAVNLGYRPATATDRSDGFSAASIWARAKLFHAPSASCSNASKSLRCNFTEVIGSPSCNKMISNSSTVAGNTWVIARAMRPTACALALNRVERIWTWARISDISLRSIVISSLSTNFCNREMMAFTFVSEIGVPCVNTGWRALTASTYVWPAGRVTTEQSTTPAPFSNTTKSTTPRCASISRAAAGSQRPFTCAIRTPLGLRSISWRGTVPT